MEAFVIVAVIGFGLLLIELLLPTGGLLAALGVAGLTVAGLIALNSDSETADWVGGALIALGVVSAIAFYFVTRKVIAAHRLGPVRSGAEELLGAVGEARSDVDPDGQVQLAGTLWSARLASGDPPVRLGDKVRVEAVEGLTLIVRPQAQSAEPTREGVS
ncbi:MAG TPA: NfeD family protein [Solirubrobacterales bacterium]|jgi:membrane-bound serine protease (ClpP class)|nr:NfeD family protein [Solirubrobacterales bacterium]